ncbi:MAG: porin [Hyphomicrobiales bacterium]|nr:MAG: porin [Hyphomicrobiales bacterium]
MTARELWDSRILGGTFACLIVVPAIAAEPGQKPPADFSGYFLGGGVGLAWGSSTWTAHGPSTDMTSGQFDYFQSFDAFRGTGSHYISLHAGRNFRLSSGLMLGIVTDLQAPSKISDTANFASPAVGQGTFEEKVVLSGAVRGRLGIVQSDRLWYGTAGYAWSFDHITRTQLAGTPAGGTAPTGLSETRHLFRNGWVVGGGIETPVAANWTANLEYLFTSFGTQRVTFPNAAQGFASDLSLQSIRLSMSYQFGAEVASVVPKPPVATDWAVHAQTTYVHQYAFPFHSPYAGTNSFAPGQSRQTWDATFYLGWRPWRDAEIWLNPEIDQGFGLSNTLGVAGFVSGEAYKLGAVEPYARVPRAFLRQTINLDGATEAVEAAPNQLKGTARSNRVVLTVGKFGVADIFDANKYSHDPRVDFLNWSLIDTGTFDYAADAWGFTYGAAAEWYTGPWTFRAGLFDLPTVPNSTVLDPTFSQVQWIGEIERRHEWWGRPGKIAITGFLTRSRMGQFHDATAIARATGEPADISGVRQYRSRAGIGMNLEQQITPNIGMFARAGWADGRSESFAFTDIDRTVAAGIVVTGNSWGRPDHSIGVGGVLNAISRERQAYLNAGGLGILVGDGQLSRPAAEHIVEVYYSLPVASWRLTVDYQYVGNPAYNMERGPISVIGTRLRKQF